MEKAHSSHVICNGSNSTILTPIPSRPCRSRQPERALRSRAAYSTPTAIRDSQQHVGICILRDTPANYSCSLLLVCCLCSFWLRDLRPHPGLVALVWPALTAAHPWRYIHSECIFRASATSSSLSRCWGVCISRWHYLCQRSPGSSTVREFNER